MYGNIQSFHDLEGTRRNFLFKTMALNEGHRNIGLSIRFVDLKNSADVGMIECSGSLGFLDEALFGLLVSH